MYHFIVNPAARGGTGERIWKKLEHQLQKCDVEYQAHLTTGPGDATNIAAHLTENTRESKIIVVVGGDGTVNEVLDGLTFAGQITLGYIPAGTGNDLARGLGLPKCPARCLKKVLNPKYHKYLDYGVLSYEAGEPVHRRFMVSSGIGLDASVCHKLLDIRRGKRHRFMLPGKITYLLLGLRQLFLAKPVKGYLILDDIKKVEYNHIYFISAYIHRHEGGGLLSAPQADCSDGTLEVCVVHNASRLKVLPILFDAVTGRMGRHPGMRFYSCREVQIHVDRPMPVHVDGESCFSQTDIRLHCIEKKIRMMI